MRYTITSLSSPMASFFRGPIAPMDPDDAAFWEGRERAAQAARERRQQRSASR